jgi:hypothetical protein
MCIPISKCVITIDYAIKGGLEVKLPSYEKLLVVVEEKSSEDSCDLGRALVCAR